MSETDTTMTNSKRTHLTESGLIESRIAFDSVSVRENFDGVYLKVQRHGRKADIVLSPDEARHIAACLGRCADVMQPILERREVAGDG